MTLSDVVMPSILECDSIQSMPECLPSLYIIQNMCKV